MKMNLIMMTKNKYDDNNKNKKAWNLSGGNKYYRKVAQQNIL